MMARPTPDRYREDEERRAARGLIEHASAEQLAIWNAADRKAGRAPDQVTASQPRRWPW